VQYVCTKWLNLQGFFDAASHMRNLPIYEFMVRLGRDGKEYPVRSHELPNGACGISTMLVGRGTIIHHRWGMRVDAAGQPYIETDCGRSYLVDGEGNYEALQEQYAQASRASGDHPDVQVIGQMAGQELSPAQGPSEDHQGSNMPLEDTLDTRSLSRLRDIRELMSSEDYAATVASILEPEDSETPAGFNELSRRLDPIPE
jgi:hypothetical protein